MMALIRTLSTGWVWWLVLHAWGGGALNITTEGMLDTAVQSTLERVRTRLSATCPSAATGQSLSLQRQPLHADYTIQDSDSDPQLSITCTPFTPPKLLCSGTSGPQSCTYGLAAALKALRACSNCEPDIVLQFLRKRAVEFGEVFDVPLTTRSGTVYPAVAFLRTDNVYQSVWMVVTGSVEGERCFDKVFCSSEMLIRYCSLFRSRAHQVPCDP